MGVFVIKEDIKSTEGKHILTQILVPFYSSLEVAQKHIPKNTVGFDMIITYSIKEIPVHDE